MGCSSSNGEKGKGEVGGKAGVQQTSFAGKVWTYVHMIVWNEGEGKDTEGRKGNALGQHNQSVKHAPGVDPGKKEGLPSICHSTHSDLEVCT